MNEMVVNTKYEEEISDQFVSLISARRMEAHVDVSLRKVSGNIEENGGKIMDLDNPKLTHVVVDKRDVSRRITLMQRTSQ